MKYQYYYERERKRLAYRKTAVNVNYDVAIKGGMLIYAITGSAAFILAVTSILHDTLMLIANAV